MFTLLPAGFDPVGSIRCFVEVMAKGKAKSTFCKNHNPRELQESSLELEARDVDENVLLSRDNEVDFEARELEDEALEARDVFHPQMEERDVEAVAEGLLRRIAPNCTPYLLTEEVSDPVTRYGPIWGYPVFW